MPNKERRLSRRERKAREGADAKPVVRNQSPRSRALEHAPHLWTELAMLNITGQSPLPPSERGQIGMPDRNTEVASANRTREGHVGGCRAIVPERRHQRRDAAVQMAKTRGPKPMKRDCSPTVGSAEPSAEGEGQKLDFEPVDLWPMPSGYKEPEEWGDGVGEVGSETNPVVVYAGVQRDRETGQWVMQVL